MFRSIFSRGLLAAVVAVSLTSAARADFQFQITTSGGFNSGVLTFAGNPGDFSGSYGGFTIASGGATFSTSPALGDLLSSALRVTNTNAGAQTITIRISVNSLLAPPSPLAYASTFSGNWNSLAAGSNVNATTYFGQTNVLFDPTNPIAFSQQNAPDGVIGSFNSTLGGPTQTYGVDGYSLTHVIVVTLSSTGTLQFTLLTEVTPVPEPTTIVGAFIGLSSLGLYRLRRRTPKAVA